MSDSQYIDIPLDQLHDSPTQPRLVYDDAYLQELGADIKSHGRNLSPLLVRPRVPDLFAAVGDPELSRDATAGYEIVFGHCRARGCEIAGLATARCEVRSMADEEVERAQISENLQRKNVHPFEEAQGYQALIERHKDTADAIAERTGKSRSYIYGRLKLLSASTEVRKSCLAGEIDAEVALLIARLRTPKLQQQALSRIDGKNLKVGDGGKKSYRNIRDLLKEQFTLDLKKTLWNVADATLLPSAGACTTCPKRSANAPEYEDLLQERKDAWRGRIPGDPNLCTDPDCFAAKKTAHLQAEASKLTARGEVVIDGNKARAAIGADGKVKGAYIALADVKDAIQAANKGVPFPIKPQVVTIQNPRDGKLVKAIKVDDLKVCGVKVSEPDQRSAANSAARQKAEAKRWADARATAAAMTKANLQLLQRVRQAMEGSERDAMDLQLAVQAGLAGVGYYDKPMLAELWGEKDIHALLKRVGQLKIADLTRLLLDCALVGQTFVDQHNLKRVPEALQATAKRYGVAIEPPEPPAAPAPTSSPAARANNNAKVAPKTVARYRNAATGETWSGRGLMPKWLKAATAAGAKLSDFEQGSSQAGSAGSDDKGAGVAVAEGLQGEEQGAEA